MKGEDEDAAAATAAIPVSIPSPKKDGSAASVFGRNGYKFWVLMALFLLASWSMFTGSVSLKWTSSYLTRFSSDHADLAAYADHDILELEQREKVVKKMWDAYSQRGNAPLTRFWLEALEAAYEQLSSEVPGVRDAAVAEIAKLSMRSHHFSVHSWEIRGN